MQTNAKANLYVALNVLSMGIVMTINTLSNSLPLNGKTPGQLSDQYPNLFVPSGGTFAIWGVIYTGLLSQIIWQIWGIFNAQVAEKSRPIVLRNSFYFALTCLFNVAWLFAWHWEKVGLSVAVMLLLLASLTVFNVRSQSGLAAFSTEEKWYFHAPMGLYWGWISIATIANVTAWLVSIGWSGWGFSMYYWTVFVMAVGTFLAAYVVYVRGQIFYGLAVMWALMGIAIKRQAAGDAVSAQLVTFSGCCMGLLLMLVLVRVPRWLRL
jgi:hypothetical protein